jgi:Arc/MetJ family transcription regulator
MKYVSINFGYMLPAMKRRTSMYLDRDLVDAAAAALGTEKTTETVHEAMREVVARARRRKLAARDLPDLTPEAIEAMRRARASA